jgi:hypothetical protein
MQKLFKILLVGLTFLALNVGTVSAQIGILPTADDSARPIGEGGEGGGPAAQDMSGNMINDGGHGANSGKALDCDERCTQVKAEAAKRNAKMLKIDACLAKSCGPNLPDQAGYDWCFNDDLTIRQCKDMTFGGGGNTDQYKCPLGPKCTWDKW